MLTRTPGKIAKAASTPGPAAPTRDDATIDTLVRRLVAEARTPAPVRAGPLPAVPPATPVLLDTEVDGIRCVLLARTGAPAAASTPARGSAPDAGAQLRPATLSPREREIVRMVAQGYPNKIIADVLEISTWTVGTHLRRIFAKLGVTSRAAMVARIMEQGLLG